MEAGTLKKVIPIASSIGAHLTIISVEIYEQAVVVTWLDKRGAPAQPPPDWRAPLLHIEDDHQTEYEYELGGASYGDAGPLRGECLFTPSIPIGAKRLRVLTEEGTLDIPIESLPQSA